LIKGSGKVIPFYAPEYPRLFEIERRCMDREGVVIRYLDSVLPSGRVLDIGAGDGFTASALSKPGRVVVPLEPVPEMIDRSKALRWVRGVAQELPFRARSFAAAYATWAYFFPSIGHGDAGLRDVHRVVVPGGRIVIVDNAGGDEFCALSDRDIASDPAWWKAQGFICEVLRTSFRFNAIEEARELLSFYFGQKGREGAKLEIEYKVAVYLGHSKAT
jgi:SAM-dependent methyltransferase